MVCTDSGEISNCLGGGMNLLATGTGDIHRFEGDRAMMIRNNDYHNSTNCITIQGYHSEHQGLAIRWGNYPPRKAYMHLHDIDKREPGNWQVVYHIRQKQKKRYRNGSS